MELHDTKERYWFQGNRTREMSPSDVAASRAYQQAFMEAYYKDQRERLIDEAVRRVLHSKYLRHYPTEIDLTAKIYAEAICAEFRRLVGE